jgi:hypothetical protein
MGAVLDAYRRYRQLLFAGDYQRLSEVADEQWIETCVGLTGWTVGLDVAATNFAAGIARAFSELSGEELDLLEKDDTLVISGRKALSGSSGRTRTYNPPVNSRMLYR